ncbi:MAG: type II toxin-antitoxin system HicB family antitoxin [Dehalococcoidia bacterium]
MAEQTVHAVIYKDAESDQWVAVCLEYDVTTQGDSEDDALKMIREAVELHIEDMSAEELETAFMPVDSTPVVRELNIRAPAILKR